MRIKTRMPIAAISGLQIGNAGVMIKKGLGGSVSVNPPSINAGTSANVDVSVNGLTTSMLIFVTPPADLEDDLEFRGASIPSNGTLRIRLRNNGAAAVDGAARTWFYLAYQV